MTEHHHGIKMVVGAKIQVSAGVSEYFIAPRKIEKSTDDDSEVIHALLARVKKNGDRITFKSCRPYYKQSTFKVFVPKDTKDGDELYFLWVDPTCACLVTAKQYEETMGVLPEDETVVETG